MSITRAWIILGLVTAVTSATALVKNKFAAVMLGPEGIGILAQANVLITFAGIICTLGMGQGIVKHLAERTDSDLEGISPREILTTSASIQLAVLLSVVTLIVLFQSVVSELVFGQRGLNHYVLAAAAAIPATVASLNLGYFLQGNNLLTRFSIGSGVNAALSLAIFVALVLPLGLDGAVLSVAVSAFVSSFVFGLLSIGRLRAIWIRRVRSIGHMAKASRVLRTLLLFGLVAFFGAALDSLNALILRSWIVNAAGPAENGMYQAVLSLSGQYIGFFTLFNATYLLPKMSGMNESDAIVQLTNSSLRLGFVFLTPVLAVFAIMRSEVILTLFTPAFLGASELIVWQVLGDFLKVASWFLTASLIPMGRLRGYAALVFAFSVINLPLSFGLLYSLGTVGITIAYFITYLLYFGLVIILQRRAIDFRFSYATLRMMASSAVTITALTFYPTSSYPGYIVGAVVLFAWGVHVLWEMRDQIAAFRQRFRVDGASE